MEGTPEGVDRVKRRGFKGPVILVIGVIFAVYLIFRLVQGVLWLTGHL
jgi:hypothetical protein